MLFVVSLFDCNAKTLNVLGNFLPHTNFHFSLKDSFTFTKGYDLDLRTPMFIYDSKFPVVK